VLTPVIPETYDLLLLGTFFADALVTSIAAWLLVSASGHGGRGCLEAGLAWFLSFIALIAGAGIVLGMTGGFGGTGFLAVHGIALTGLVLARKQSLAADLAAWGQTCRQTRQFFNTPGNNRLLGLGLLVILAGLTMISIWAEPAGFDALTYHLPRVGHWLQDGKIRVLGTADPRLNYVAVLPDIVMAWLVGSTREGFRPAVVAQAIGGIMAVGATVGLARQSGLGRSASLLAGVLLLGMANVVIQFTAAQTDLFTSGVFAVSFYLWLIALQRGGDSPLGALGAGLALGAKGTLFYMFPSILLWVAWLVWHQRLPRSTWRRTLLMAAFGIGLFALPGFVRNWQAYGNPLGPAAWVKEIHQGFDSVSGQSHKIYWNLTSALVQSFDPHSQPYGLRTISRSAGMALARQLPAKDNYTLAGFARRMTLEKIMLRTTPDADVTSFGVVTFLLFSAGSLIALTRWRHSKGRLVLVWSAGVVMFLLFYNVMQQWHPFAFRYYNLVAPWIAIVSAWGIEQLGWRSRLAVWTVVAASALDIDWHVTAHTPQGGWATVVQPERSDEYFVALQWREWSHRLDHVEEPFLLSLPAFRPIAAFYRQWPRREVGFKSDPGNGTATAEEFVRGEKGWIIVPATRFLGLEGHVASSVYLFEGNEKSIFSLAAYRTLDAGEKPKPIIYRQRLTETEKSVIYDLLVKTGGGNAIRLAFANPGKSACRYSWTSPLALNNGVLAAGDRMVIEMPMPADAVGEVQICFGLISGQNLGQDLPTVELEEKNPLSYSSSAK
jgi:hypothetical protein